MRRWNGWGDENKEYPLPESAKIQLVNVLGEGDTSRDASLLEVTRLLPESRFTKFNSFSTDPEDRIRHACRQSLPDWIHLRSGRIPSFPDGVIYPNSEDKISKAIDLALSNKWILVLYGGGTSVLGHINPPQSDTPVLTIDISRLNELIDFDETSLLATFEAGIKDPFLENELSKLGYTLGHFPQSFEFSTLGGWIATRSSGQQSYYYGQIEDLFKGGSVTTPMGSIDFPSLPASAAGPDLRHLILGSEGRYGIISQATVEVKTLPEFEEFYGIFFKECESGMRAVREIAQKDIRLSMLRLSDAQETETTLLLTGNSNLIRWADFGLNKLGYELKRCLLIIGVIGDKERAIQSRNEAKNICSKNGALNYMQLLEKSYSVNNTVFT